MPLTRKQEDAMKKFEKNSLKIIELIEKVKRQYQDPNPSFTKEETPKVFSDIKYFIDYTNDVLPGGITELLDDLKSGDHETLQKLLGEHPVLLTKTNFFERIDVKQLNAAANVERKNPISDSASMSFRFFSQKAAGAEQAANAPKIEPGKEGPGKS